MHVVHIYLAYTVVLHLTVCLWIDGAVSRADSVERRVESPLQRFARLRSELADLKADLDVMTVSLYYIFAL